MITDHVKKVKTSGSHNPYIVYYSKAGRPFYYNTQTNRASWIVPKEDRVFFLSKHCNKVSAFGDDLQMIKKDKQIFFDLLEQNGIDEDATINCCESMLKKNVLFKTFNQEKTALFEEFIRHKKKKKNMSTQKKQNVAIINVLKECLKDEYVLPYEYDAFIKFVYKSKLASNYLIKRDVHIHFLINRYLYFYMRCINNKKMASKCNVKRLKRNDACINRQNHDDKTVKTCRESTIAKNNNCGHVQNKNVNKRRIDCVSCNDMSMEMKNNHKICKRNTSIGSKDKITLKTNDKINAESDHRLCERIENIVLLPGQSKYLSTRIFLSECLGILPEEYNRIKNYLLAKIDVYKSYTDIKDDDFLNQFNRITVLLIYREIFMACFALNDITNEDENNKLVRIYIVKLKNLINMMYMNGQIYYKMKFTEFLSLVKDDEIIKVLSVRKDATKNEFDYFISANHARLDKYANNFTSETRKKLNKIDLQAILSYYKKNAGDEVEEGEIKTKI